MQKEIAEIIASLPEDAGTDFLSNLISAIAWTYRPELEDGILLLSAATFVLVQQDFSHSKPH